MKIKDIKYEEYLRDSPIPPPPRILGKHWGVTKGKMPFPILKIITDEGIEGYSLSYKVIPKPVIDKIKRIIIGVDPFNREWIWQEFATLHAWGRIYGEYGRETLGDLAAVDIALWDIAGKALGLPIYKLLGGYRDKIRIYASSYRLPTPGDYAEEALSCKEQGITAYKLHVDSDIAIDACRAVRKAVGDDMTLMLDGGTGNSREQALRVGRVLEELNFYWFEQPLSDDDIEGLVRLREKLTVPICATECVAGGMFSIPEYLLRGACDMVRCDSLISGGITPCKKIADMCDAFGVLCEIHLAGQIPNLHVECAIRNCTFHEMFWPEVRNYGLKEYPVLDDEGYLHVPQKPGLGVEIDWESLGKPIASY